jgi:hypothetical protein
LSRLLRHIGPSVTLIIWVAILKRCVVYIFLPFDTRCIHTRRGNSPRTIEEACLSTAKSTFDSALAICNFPQKNMFTLKSEELRIASTKITIFWNVMPCSLVGNYDRFREICRFHISYSYFKGRFCFNLQDISQYYA